MMAMNRETICSIQRQHREKTRDRTLTLTRPIWKFNLHKTMATFHLLLSFCFLSSVVSIGMDYICPKFHQGLNEVTCKINTTAANNATCDSLQKNVTFEKGGAKLCYAPSPVSGCNESQNTSSNPCWCVKSDNIFTYTFLFNATSRDLGAVVECKYCITASNTNDIVGCNISSFDPGKQASRAHMIYTTPAWLLPVFLSFNGFYVAHSGA